MEKLGDLSLTTSEDRYNQVDMSMAYKILTRKEDVNLAEWFDMTTQAARVMRTEADPLNVRVRHM